MPAGFFVHQVAAGKLQLTFVETYMAKGNGAFQRLGYKKYKHDNSKMFIK